MRKIVRLNKNWQFFDKFNENLIRHASQGESVILPHNALDLPLNYFDEACYQRQFCYQIILEKLQDYTGKSISLVFDGAMANSHIYLNGNQVAVHKDGYTPFEVKLSPALLDSKNLITVVIDGQENPTFPPFGGQIDYLTYSGIYRDVWIKITDPISIDHIKLETPNPLSPKKSLCLWCSINGMDQASTDMFLKLKLQDITGRPIAESTTQVQGCEAKIHLKDIEGIHLWDLDTPNLYDCIIQLSCDNGYDEVVVKTGFREARFSADGFRLNGRLLKICGLNRHQSYPYVGYAMGRRAQERDAEILKYDLGCNLVRTSHYPQSPWFLDHCDRIGLLVFEEIPGWQHIGGPDWQKQHLDNVKAMIRRDWNRPSIILWGVRINESADLHDLYIDSNALARHLDPTRPTAGVRNIPNSELLEDVYTMNDFIIGSEIQPWVNHKRRALRSQKEVTGLNRDVPYLVTEFNGHMYPTKYFDNEERHIEHVTRYLQVLDRTYADPAISGCIGWCMFDYNTHKDFGSGDRICHHGVLDMFRMPKFAAYVYASQLDPSENICMIPVTYWARGERSIGGVLPLIVLTNCDELQLMFGSEISLTGVPDRVSYPHIPRPPVTFTYHNFENRDLGHWGQKWENLTLHGYVDGNLVAEYCMVANPILSRLVLQADDNYLLTTELDEVRIQVKALDQFDNPVPYINDPVNIETSGPAFILGPDQLSLQGGKAAFWIRSNQMKGPVIINARTPRLDPVSLTLNCVDSLTG